MNSDDIKRFDRLANKIQFIIDVLTNKQIHQDSLIQEALSFIVVYTKKSLSFQEKYVSNEARQFSINLAYKIINQYCYFLYEKKKSSDGQIISDAVSVLLILACNPKYEHCENYLLTYELKPYIDLLLVKKLPPSTKKQILKILGHIIYVSDQLAVYLIKNTSFYKIILDQSGSFKLQVFTILANLATIEQLHQFLSTGLLKISFLFLSQIQYETKKQLLRFFENWFEYRNQNIKKYQNILQFLSQNHQNDERLIIRESKFWCKLVQNGYKNKIPNHILNYQSDQRDTIKSMLSSHRVTT